MPCFSRLLFLVTIMVSTTFTVVAQCNWPPSKTNRLVNDYSGIFSTAEASAVEQRLIAFSDSTSNQILVVITPTLCGVDEQLAAQQIGEAWGVGQHDFDNGLVILIKSKTDSEPWGAVALATGYGVEGVLPDIFCRRIIDDEMLPALSEGDYLRAIKRALDVVEPVMRGEYSYNQYKRDGRTVGLISVASVLIIVILIILLIWYDYKKHPDHWNDNGRGGDGGVFWGGTIGGFGSSRSSWGGGSSWSGGGFGGFGGGSFGGGGASGRF